MFGSKAPSSSTMASSLSESFLGNRLEQRAHDKVFSDRPSFVSFSKLAVVFITTLAFFFMLWFLKPELGFGEISGLSLIITAHGGSPKNKHAWNDIQVYSMIPDDKHGGLSSEFGSKDTLGLLGSDLRHRAEVANPRGLHLYKSNTSLVDDPPGLFLLQAWRKHSKILYYPNACERHGDTLMVWKDLKDTPCVHPYDINIVDDRVYVLCQTSHNVFYYNLHDPSEDGVFVGNFDNPRGIATSTDRSWIYIAERNKNRLVVKDIMSNDTIGYVNLHEHVIGVVLNQNQTLLYVGERNTGRINYHDAVTFEHKGYFAHDDIHHPAGLAIQDGYLYVISKYFASFVKIRKHSTSSLPKTKPQNLKIVMNRYVVCQANNHVVGINLETGDAHIAVKHIQTRSENMRVLPCVV